MNTPGIPKHGNGHDAAHVMRAVRSTLAPILCTAFLMACGGGSDSAVNNSAAIAFEARTQTEQDPTNAGVVQRNSLIDGLTYGQWSAAWWQWAVKEPSSMSPLNQAPCGTDQSGLVWFLAGSPGTPAVTRPCRVPLNKHILFPVITAEWSVAEAIENGGSCPIRATQNGTSSKGLSACAKAFIDLATLLEVDVDGRALVGLHSFRFQSPDNPPASFTPVDGNVPGIPAGPTNFVSDGYWIMLSPLSAGSHTVHFHGTLSSKGATVFDTEATYNLTIGG